MTHALLRTEEKDTERWEESSEKLTALQHRGSVQMSQTSVDVTQSEELLPKPLSAWDK